MDSQTSMNTTSVNTTKSFNLSAQQQKKFTTIGIIAITALILITSIYFATKENTKIPITSEINTNSQDNVKAEVEKATIKPVQEETPPEITEPIELPSETYMNDSDFPEMAMFTLSGYDITIHFPKNYIIANHLDFDNPAYHLSIILEDEKDNNEPIERPLIIIGKTDYFADWALVLENEESDYETINVAGNEYKTIQYANGEGYGSIGWSEKTVVTKIDENLYVMIFNYSSSATPGCTDEYGCTEEDYSYTMSEEQIETALKILEQAIFIKL